MVSLGKFFLQTWGLMVEVIKYLQKYNKIWLISDFKTCHTKKQMKDCLVSFEKKATWLNNFIPSQGFMCEGQNKDTQPCKAVHHHYTPPGKCDLKKYWT